MSEPKRYEVGVNFIAPVFVPVETEAGDWIRYVDYAILRSVAEDNKRECEATRIENARLKAEVERLTKAGDAMVSEWASGEEKGAKNFLKALVIWNAAKEGKQP